MISDRFGDPVILLQRAAAIDALEACLPAEVLSLGTEVTSVEPGGTSVARVGTTAGELDADLVVAADGIGSGTRSVLFPGQPGLRYAGFTTWRLLTGPLTGQFPMAESWGRGTVFGVMPLSDGAITRPQDVLRHDVAELAAPLPSFHRGRVALLGRWGESLSQAAVRSRCHAWGFLFRSKLLPPALRLTEFDTLCNRITTDSHQWFSTSRARWMHDGGWREAHGRP
jgi:2-polyprenyl-6-methoxyphenol hydroxylase-like FAD-dependent oxidoreductase